MNGATLTRVAVRPLDVAMSKAFGIAGGAQPALRNALVEFELASGIRGYGEAAPLPAFDGETQQIALAALERAAPQLVGSDVRRWRPLAERIGELARESASAVCALEMAMFDALTRYFSTSLRVFCGGVTDELVTDVTITTGTESEARDEANRFRDFSTLKIKIGGTDIDHDLRRIFGVHATRPDARLLLDANASLTFDGAIALAGELARRSVPIALFEQPIAKSDFAALGELRARIGIPIAADEAVRTAADLASVHHHSAADVVNVKLMKGGIVAALDVIATARALGIGLMIGGMVESRLAMGASASIAAGSGEFSFVDLDTPLFLARDPFTGGYTQHGAVLDLSEVTLGHGCTPIEED